MLTRPPTFSLIIDYDDEDRYIATNDEEGISLALRFQRRVRRIQLWMPAPTLRRLLANIDGEFPILENLYIKPLTNNVNGLPLPSTSNAPHLRHFALRDITYPPEMFHPPSTNTHLPPTGNHGQFVLYYGPQLLRSLKMFVHILDDDSLLNIFHFCRPAMVNENEARCERILQGGEWVRERWWYKLAHVCQRWRCLIMALPSHLDLCLVCTPGTPVAEMITNSPPLPLIIDHIHGNGSITAEDEEGIIFALRHRDRVRRIRLRMPLLNLQKLVLALDGDFPMLEHLYIAPPTKSRSWPMFSNTLQAPRLRHLILLNFALPIQSPLILSNTGLVTFSLRWISQSEYSHPNDLLQQLSLMPQLETLRITFQSPVPNRELERQLMHRPVTTTVTLPNLRWLGLRAASTYVEAILSRMTTPLLERLEIRFFLQLNYSMPHFLEFMGAARNLRFGSVKFYFFDYSVFVYAYRRDGGPMYSFATDISCGHLDWQVSFAAQLFRTLRTVFSEVECLTLEFWRNLESPKTNNDVDRTQWRELLGSFNNVKILRVDVDFLGQISRSLQVGSGESPLELLPELEELQIRSFHDGDAFEEFINARQDAGHPVTLVRDDVAFFWDSPGPPSPTRAAAKDCI